MKRYLLHTDERTFEEVCALLKSAFSGFSLVEKETARGDTASANVVLYISSKRLKLSKVQLRLLTALFCQNGLKAFKWEKVKSKLYYSGLGSTATLKMLVGYGYITKQEDWYKINIDESKKNEVNALLELAKEGLKDIFLDKTRFMRYETTEYFEIVQAQILNYVKQVL